MSAFEYSDGAIIRYNNSFHIRNEMEIINKKINRIHCVIDSEYLVDLQLV